MARPDQKCTTVPTGGDSESPPDPVNHRTGENAVVGWISRDVDEARLTSCFHPNTTQSGKGSTQTLPLAFPVPNRVQFGQLSNRAGQTSGRLIPTRRGNPCAICGDTSGDCREKQYDDLRLCAHQGDLIRLKDTIHGADGGRWTLFKRSDRWNAFAPARDAKTAIRTSAPTFTPKPSVTRLSVQQRHQAFTLLAERLSLHANDADDLLRRGFTADQIQQIGAKTIHQGLRFNEAPMGLPGFENRRFVSQTGYVVFTHNWHGQITGGQIRPRGEKYRWLQNVHLPTGELPLQILKGDPNQPVFWVEGIGAKPWWVHLQTGATVIGAAGGNFASSPLQVTEVLQFTAGQQQILLPDGDSLSNDGVLIQYRRLAGLVPNLLVRWWSQFHKGSDCDETDAWLNGSDIPSTEFFDPQQLSLRQARGGRFVIGRVADITLNDRFLPSGLVAGCENRLVGVISGLGTGKTESQREIVRRAHAEERPVIALSTLRRLSQQQARRIGVPYIEEGRTEDLDRETDRSYGIAYRQRVGFACCTASLRATSALKFNPDDFKGAVVILDEWDTVAEDLVTNQQTDVAKHRVEIAQAIEALVKNAHQVFVLSGTLRRMDLDFIEAWMGETAFLIHNTYKPADGRQLTCFTREALLRSNLTRSLQAGRRALVHTSDQQQSTWAASRVAGAAKAMVSSLTDKNVEFLDGDASRNGNDVQKRLAKDPNAVLRRLDLAVFSPAVNTGVDITVRDHFHSVHIFSRGHLSVSDVVQVGGRLRDHVSRLLYVPEKAPTSNFGGQTYWRAIRDQVDADRRLLADIIEVSALAGTVAKQDPLMVYACRVYAQRNLESLHYRQLILDGYKRQGYDITTVDREPTSQEQQQNRRQKEHVTRINDQEAIAIAQAPMPSADQVNIPAASRKKAQVVKVFGIDPNDLTAHHIQEADKALRGLRNRFLYTDPMARQFNLSQRLEERASRGDLNQILATDAALVGTAALRLAWLQQLLKSARAEDLFTRTDWFDYRDPMVRRIHRAVLEDPQSKRFIGSRHTSFKDPIGVIQSILSVLGFTTESRQTRIDGRVVRQHRIADPFREFRPDRVLQLWRQQPELLLNPNEEPSGDAGVTDYP